MVGIVRWGDQSSRLHKNEIRRRENMQQETQQCIDGHRRFHFTWAFQSFSGPQGQTTESYIKRSSLPGAIYFDELGSLFGMVSCFNASSSAEKDLFDPILPVPLKSLTDDVLNKWYPKHNNKFNEEPFGHDVSNPFDFPYIKDLNPRRCLQRQ